MKASVIIRAFNEEKYIGRLLEGIVAQEMPAPFEIILVDSGSTDKTVTIAERYPVTIVRIKPEDFSFGYSLNRGIEASSGEYAVFISAHCYPEDKNWLRELIAPFEDETVAVVYGRQRGDGTTRYSEGRIFEKWFPTEGGGPQDHPFCNNANAAVRRSLWEKTPYDETLPGLEDLDWAKKNLDNGNRIYYNPGARIIHIHNETLQQIYNRYRREAIAFHHIFETETFSLWDFFKLSLLNIVADISQGLREKRIPGEIWGIVRFRFQQFRGTYMGFKHKREISPELR
ncbi:MAG: glycosyltransferase, partial [bacterium]|nr:glycosyltransferase [bacterium]